MHHRALLGNACWSELTVTRWPNQGVGPRNRLDKVRPGDEGNKRRVQSGTENRAHMTHRPQSLGMWFAGVASCSTCFGFRGAGGSANAEVQ
jgi:hypothetical protein